MRGEALRAPTSKNQFFERNARGVRQHRARFAPNAQWEIRQYAEAVGQLVAKFSRTWALFSEKP